MLTAGVTSLVFKLLKQPVVLGYIVAGVLVGPHVLGDSWVSNEESVNTWGEIGVLFLLFALGLEFSFKKLLQVGSAAIVAAAVIVAGMMGLGFLAGRALGWDETNALFLGGMLCMSSTTIVFKALDDMGLRTHKFARICFGILVVEDLFAVVLMVLLSSIVTTRHFEGAALLAEIGKLAAYLVLWFVVGIAVIPLFLRKFSKHLSDETLTIFSVGMCLGMVLLAVGAGFSSALGAFVMGSVLAETLEAERIEHLVQPVKDIFGSIFFVSVGMMISPAQLAEHWMPIAALTAVVIAGQIFWATAGTLLSGQSLKVSVQTGFSLVQIGEFAFIIAAMGQRLGVTDRSLYPIVVAVSVATTFLTPFIMRLAIPAYSLIDAHMSPGTRMVLEKYARARGTATMQSTWRRLLHKVAAALAVYGVLVAFAYALFFNYVSPWLLGALPDSVPDRLVEGVELAALLALVSPLVYAMATAYRQSEEARALWRSGTFHKAQLIAVSMLRSGCAVAFVAYPIARTYSITWAVVAGAAILCVAAITLSRRVRRHSTALTRQFAANLAAREKSAEAKRTMSRRFADSLLDYDVHLAEFRLDASSAFGGQSLKQLDIRTRSGVSVVRIVRGGMNVNIPGGSTVLYPGDLVVVAGSDAQIDRFKALVEESARTAGTGRARERVDLERIQVESASRLVGTSIADSGIRERAHCVVMGIERGGRVVMNPDPQLTFEADDVVIVAGETEGIRHFVAQAGLGA